MKVLVMRQIAANEKDIEIVMVARHLGSGLSMVSPIVTLEGEAPFASGNPYGVYGDACADFTGVDALDCDITITECVSGNLDGWR